jgi:hypothetical protein
MSRKARALHLGFALVPQLPLWHSNPLDWGNRDAGLRYYTVNAETIIESGYG